MDSECNPFPGVWPQKQEKKKGGCNSGNGNEQGVSRSRSRRVVNDTHRRAIRGRRQPEETTSPICRTGYPAFGRASPSGLPGGGGWSPTDPGFGTGRPLRAIRITAPQPAGSSQPADPSPRASRPWAPEPWRRRHSRSVAVVPRQSGPKPAGSSRRHAPSLTGRRAEEQAGRALACPRSDRVAWQGVRARSSRRGFAADARAQSLTAEFITTMAGDWNGSPTSPGWTRSPILSGWLTCGSR